MIYIGDNLVLCVLIKRNIVIPSIINVLASTSSRAKRQKVDKTGRGSALERLREVRSGGKRKYEIKEIENVYDEVDEKEYSNTVLKRQRDDWIVDDGIFLFYSSFMLFCKKIEIFYYNQKIRNNFLKETFFFEKTDSVAEVI